MMILTHVEYDGDDDGDDDDDDDNVIATNGEGDQMI